MMKVIHVLSLCLLSSWTALAAPPVRHPPTRHPVASPVKITARAPVKKPVKAPVKAPVKITVRAPIKKPVKAPVKAPVKKPVKTPIKQTPHAPIPNLSKVGMKIATYAPGSYNAFVPGSYQLKALKYVESIPGANYKLTAAKAVQYYALACLFYATNAVPNQVTSHFGVAPKGWFTTTNWLSTTVDPCSGSWNGVTCVNGKVTHLELSKNNLSGGIPIEITLFSADNKSGAGSLNFLDLYSNTYLFNDNDNGGMNWVGGLGSNMQKLYVGSTAMYSTTGIPTVLAKLTNLVEFDCSYTYITGALKNVPFSSLKKLQYLELDDNYYLNSTLPTVLGTLPNLMFLYAANANIAGNLEFIKTMPKIQELWLDQNYLRGTLPSNIGNLAKTLDSFSVSHNLLSGPLPASMAKLTNMKQMWLYNNKFSGTFPNSLKTLTLMQIFHIENNNLQGNVGTLCSVLGPPVGIMTTLGVDCGSSNKVVCPSSCKICCCSQSQCNDS